MLIRYFLLAVFVLATSGCAYLGNAVKQAGYQSKMKFSPTQGVYKHMLETENFFVFGKVKHEAAINGDPLAVVVLSDLRRKNEVVEVCNFARIDSYYGLNLPAGEYRLLVVSDLNRDGFYDESEVIGGRILILDIREQPDKVLGSFDIDLKRTFVRQSGELFRLQVRKPGEMTESLFYPRGSIRPLDDEIFSQKMSSLGMYEPAAFIEEAPMMFYAMEEDVGYKIPVIFVHGIDGSPRDFEEIIAHLDRTIYKPWFFYYPSGVELSRVSALFYRIFLSGEVIPLKHTPAVIVAHSMGGVVARDALNRLKGTEREVKVKRLVTIAAPMAGHPDAKISRKGPLQIPSWRDLAPDSDFMRSLRRRKLAGDLEYHLIFSYSNSHSLKFDENSDSVVPLSSQLCSEAQNEAKAQTGFNDTHTGILKNPDAVRLVTKIIKGVQPPYPEDHLKELQRGGYHVDLGADFSPMEIYIIRTMGHWLDALATGAIAPFHPVQTQFIRVSRGKKVPENEAETAWLKFVKKYPDRRGLK